MSHNLLPRLIGRIFGHTSTFSTTTRSGAQIKARVIAFPDGRYNVAIERNDSRGHTLKVPLQQVQRSHAMAYVEGYLTSAARI